MVVLYGQWLWKRASQSLPVNTALDGALIIFSHTPELLFFRLETPAALSPYLFYIFSIGGRDTSPQKIRAKGWVRGQGRAGSQKKWHSGLSTVIYTVGARGAPR